jgi:tetratricopeptide (TPR) repeat protein
MTGTGSLEVKPPVQVSVEDATIVGSATPFLRGLVCPVPYVPITDALDVLTQWVKDPGPDRCPVYVLAGGGGSGKTRLAAELCRTIGSTQPPAADDAPTSTDDATASADDAEPCGHGAPIFADDAAMPAADGVSALAGDTTPSLDSAPVSTDDALTAADGASVSAGSAGRGVLAGFVKLEKATDVSREALSAISTRYRSSLLVVDYAEDRVEAVKALMEALIADRDAGRTAMRVVLVMRRPGNDRGRGVAEMWLNGLGWDPDTASLVKLQASIITSGQVLVVRPTQPRVRVSWREDLFDAGCGVFPADPDRGALDPADVTGMLDHCDSPLHVLMVAWLANNDPVRLARIATEAPSATVVIAEMYQAVVDHEVRYWRIAQHRCKVQSLEDTDLMVLAALVTLVDVHPSEDNETDRLALLAAAFPTSPADPKMMDFLASHLYLYRDDTTNSTPTGDGPTPAPRPSWRPVEPDLLGEFLVASWLSRDVATSGHTDEDPPPWSIPTDHLSELLDTVLSPRRDLALLVRPLTVLARCAATYKPAAKALSAAFTQEHLVRLLALLGPASSARADIAQALNALVRHVQPVPLSPEHVRANPQAVDKQARSLWAAAHALEDLGYVAADVRTTCDASTVQSFEALAEANPAAYLPDLAAALNNYAIRLTDVGRRDEALDPARRALKTYEQLAEANPDVYLPDFAAALNNYAVSLGEVGRRDEALEPAHRAVETYARLDEANPDVYLPDLAMSLNNYANRLAEVGRRDEALEPAHQALQSHETLAEAKPDVYLPDLAMSLNNYANRLAEVGRRDEALEPAHQALQAHETLAEANPDVYLPDLAQSVNTYATRLAEVGRRDEALEPAHRAVEIRERLAETNPAAYLPNLAMSLNT